MKNGVVIFHLLNNKMIKKFYSLFSDTRKLLTVSFNWIEIISFCYFWSYGVFGFFTLPHYGFTTNLLLSFVLAGCFLTLFFYRNRIREYNESVTITISDVSIILLYILLMGAFSFRELLVPMNGDNFYHAQQSVTYATHVVQLLTQHTHIFDTLPFVALVFDTNFLLVLGLVAVYFLLKKLSFWWQASLLTLVFITLRMCMYLSGGNTSPFPTLRLFPLWLTSTFFGLHDISFRIASFIPLICLMFFLYLVSREKVGRRNAFLFGLVAGTIPVMWHVGLLVEFSIWTGLLVTYIIIFFGRKEEKVDGYMRPTMLIGVSTLMRVSGFIALVPLFVHYLLVQKRKLEDIKKYILQSLPTAILIMPVVVGNIVTGTSASYRGEGYSEMNLEAGANLLERLYVAVHGGFFEAIIYNSFHILSLVLIFTPIYFWRKRVYTILPTILFVGLYCVLFFSIRPILWGNGRYQAEYIAPLVIAILAGVVCMIRKNIVVTLLLLSLIVLNVYEFKHIPKYNTPSLGKGDYLENAKHKGDYFVLSEVPFDYRVALQKMKNEGLATSTYYIPGNGYSYFAKVLSGYSVKEMRHETEYRNTIGFDSSSVHETLARINKNKQINVILVNRAKNDKEFFQEKIADNLPTFGFVHGQDFIEPVYGNTISAFIRK